MKQVNGKANGRTSIKTCCNAQLSTTNTVQARLFLNWGPRGHVCALTKKQTLLSGNKYDMIFFLSSLHTITEQKLNHYQLITFFLLLT